MSVSLGRRIIKSMNGKSYTVKRASVGTYDDRGQYVEGAQSDVTVLASVQPLGPRDTVSIPEGERQFARKKLYSADEMFISNQVENVSADLVTIDGEEYRAESVEVWAQYWKVIVVTTKKPEGVMP